jgi:serine protease AprX
MNRTPAPIAMRKSSLVLGLLLALFIFMVPAAPAQSAPADGQGKVSAELLEKIRAAGADDLVSVIVQTTGDPSDAHIARLHGRGGLLKARYGVIRGYAAKVPASQIETFANDPEIEQISFDTPVRSHMDIAYPAVKADLAAKNFGVTGAGIGVAVIDTGVASHPDLQRPRGSPQVVEVEIVGHEPGLADYYGHGTHVAGIINGNGASSSDRYSYRTFKGLAPGSQILSIRALGPDGTGYTSDIISAINWAMVNRPVYNIRVMNLSLGHPVFESYRTDPLCRAVRSANDAGILAVVAAGNGGGRGTGFGTIDVPGNEPSAITVGAMDDSSTVTTTDDVLAWYSSKGPTLIDFIAKPDIAAPGTAIVSLRDSGSYLDVNYHQFTLKVGDYETGPSGTLANDGLYYQLSGTSMAAPMVTGAAALMFQKDPSLNPATVKARLMLATVKDTALVFETGAGELDVNAALGASGYASSAMSPPTLLASDSNVYMEDTALIWGSAWASSAIWGNGKGGAKGILLSDVPGSMSSTFSAIWGGGGGKAAKVGNSSLIWNASITLDGLIWGGDACSLLTTTGTVNNESAVWGGGKH